ncbi:MAG: hypothetical protein V7K89_01955 [Nostoc sp.]|uniref:hypothetical protein n=1 Tax=Nostoc sp. TaxID=1180 RepID=UPI002FF9B312
MVKRNDKEELPLQGFWFIVGAFAVVLSNVLNSTLSPLGAILGKAGIGLVGYSSINLIGIINRVIQDGITSSEFDKICRRSIRTYEVSGEFPILIGTNVEGCISTAYRGSIDIVKIAKVRAYCDFLKTDKGNKFPPIVICTGRSQGYVELLAQILGLANDDLDVPFIIEMGAAVYYPFSKITKSRLNQEDELLMHNIKSVLKKELSDIEFEPKSFIVTVNPFKTETVDKLYEKIFKLLSKQGLADMVEIIRGNTAVDITPKRINKISALEKVVEDYTRSKCNEAKNLKSIVYIAESSGDIEIINKVKRAYCSESEATPEVKQRVKDEFGENHILKKKDIDVFLTVLEETCGVKVVKSYKV